MSLPLQTVKPNDWLTVNRNFSKIKTGLMGDSASPTFAGLTLTGLTASRLVWTDASKALASKDLIDLVAGTANEIDVADDGSGGVTIGIVDPLIVGKGGTGAATLTNHGILLGSGTDAVTPLGVATNGQLPIGSTGADPVLAALTGTSNQAIVTNGAGTITLSLPQDIHTEAGPTFDTLTLSSIANEATDVDKFLVDSTGLIKYRTGAEVLSDIGASPTTHRHDTETLQHDAVNSDGGAFSFTTSGSVTFSQSLVAPGLTITNSALFGSNAVAFQPAVDSTFFIQVNDAGASPIIIVDSTNRRVGIKRIPGSYALEVGGSIMLTGTLFFDNASNSILNTSTSLFYKADANHIFQTFVSGPGWVTHFQITDDGKSGFGEESPETITEWTASEPYLTLHNSTHEDSDGGRESRLNFKGEQSGGEETAGFQFEASHDGTGDDQFFKGVWSVNTGAGLVEGLRLDSSLDIIAAGTIHTAIGGYGIKLTNNTGANSVEGQVVETDDVDENSYKVADANCVDAIGVVYNAGVADGSDVWIVTNGIAEVLLDAGGCIHHDRLICSATAGSAGVSNAPAVAVHFQEIGHAIETVVGAGLAKAVIHLL